MKKLIVSLLLVASVISLGVLIGCGSSTDTTTTATTPTTISSSNVTAAKTGVLLANGGSSVGVSASSVGASAGVSIMSVRAMEGPPDSFFTDLSTIASDGYLSPTSESFGGNMTPYIRLKTVNGDTVNNDFVSALKIGKWLTLEVETIMTTGSPGTPPPGMDAEVTNYVSRYISAYIANGNAHPFNNATIFKPVSTEAEYMAWMFMYPSIEAGISDMASHISGSPTNTIYMVTPEPTAGDKIGSMDMKMVFTKSATGEIVLNVSCQSDGKPVAGTYSGSGTLQTPAGDMSTTLSMGFSTSGPPSSVTLVGTTETAPITTVRIYMNPTTMSATGEVFDSSGTLLGTIEGSSSGGKVYIGATSEAFTF